MSERRRAKKTISLFWVILLVVLICGNFAIQWSRTQTPKDGENWVVKRVVSGQTIEAALATDDTGVVQRIRLIGISSPLREQSPWGDRAREQLEKLIKDQTVVFEFDVDRKDSSDRLLAYIWSGDRLINLQLIEEGYVLFDLMPPNVRYDDMLKRAQSEARLLENGIWDSQNPMRLTPKEFRRQLN